MVSVVLLSLTAKIPFLVPCSSICSVLKGMRTGEGSSIITTRLFAAVVGVLGDHLQRVLYLDH